MRIYALLAAMAVVHLLAGGVGSVIIGNLASNTGQADYGGESGFIPGEDSPYSAFGNFLYGSGEPTPDLPGESGGIALARYGLIDGVCVVSSAVKWGIIITTFSYPVVDIIPVEGFGLWIRLAIHVLSTGAIVAVMVRLVDLLAQMGVFSNVYILIAAGILTSVGLVSTILASAADIKC